MMKNRNDQNTLVLIADTSPLQDHTLFARLYEALPEERRKKIDAFRPESSRRQSLAAGVLLQEACRRFGIAGADGSVVLQDRGKPVFAARPEVHFNLSHSGERAMCIISPCEAGCDVERIQKLLWPVARRVFSASEQAELARCEAEGRGEEMFCRLWTRKESLIKALGSGFYEENIPDLQPPEGACFYEIDRGDGYCYTCCLLEAEKDRAPELVIIDLRELQGNSL